MYTQLLLYYFTGTGNSYRAASWLAERAGARGLPARFMPVDGARPGADVTPTSLVGLLGPAHGFTAPWALLWFALHLPRGAGAGAFVLICRGAFKIDRWVLPGLEGSAAYLLALILWLKGYRVRAASGLDMPGSWTALLPGQAPAAVEMISARARPLVEGILDRVLDGRTAFRSLLPFALGLALLPISAAYLAFGRFFLAKLFYASARCTGCGLCARACPVDGVRLRRQGLLGGGELRPFWTLRCESCTRCMNYCPEQAVEASYPFAALMMWLGGLLPVALLLNWLAPALLATGGWPAGLAELLLGYPYKLLVIVLGYAVFFRLLRARWLNRLLTALTPTRYYRRYHEPGARLADIRSKASGQ